MGKGKKKGGGGKKKAAASEQSQEEAREELLALEAIYGEDLAVHEEGLGFSLHVTPHPGEAAANHVSCQLAVRCAVASCLDVAQSLGACTWARWTATASAAGVWRHACCPPLPPLIAMQQVEAGGSRPAHPGARPAQFLCACSLSHSAMLPLRTHGCSFPDDYPHEAPGLKLSDAVGLAEEAVRQLSKQVGRLSSFSAAAACGCFCGGRRAMLDAPFLAAAALAFICKCVLGPLCHCC